jgi:hypothetical protein
MVVVCDLLAFSPKQKAMGHARSKGQGARLVVVVVVVCDLLAFSPK